MTGNSRNARCRFAGRVRCAAKRLPTSILRFSWAVISFVIPVMLIGCQRAEPTGGLPTAAIVYVDLKTGSTVVHSQTSEVPAINPATGERTLMPGLYCPKCQRWHPAPPFDKLQHIPGAATCPTDGTPLTTDGPWPQGDK